MINKIKTLLLDWLLKDATLSSRAYANYLRQKGYFSVVAVDRVFDFCINKERLSEKWQSVSFAISKKSAEVYIDEVAIFNKKLTKKERLAIAQNKLI